MLDGTETDQVTTTPPPARPPSVASVVRARSSASIRAVVVVALLLSASIVSPGLGVLLLPLIPLPYALVTLRFGMMPALAVSVGLAVAGLTAGVSGGDAVDAAALAALMAGSAGWLALVLAACGEGRPFERVPLAATTAAWLALLLAVGGLYAAQGGADSVRSTAAGFVRDVYDQALEGCDKGQPLAQYKTYCGDLRADRNQLVGITRDHGLVITGGLIGLLAVTTAATSLVLLRRLGSRRELPIAANGPFADWHAHWGSAYLLAAGLIAIMAGLEFAANDGWLVAGGTLAALLGGVLLVADGFAVALTLARRMKMRTMTKVVLVVLTVMFWWVAFGWLLVLGMFDVMLHLRERGPRTGTHQ